MITRNKGPIATIAAEVAMPAAQFIRDFKRHFGRSATEEAIWMREHRGEIA